MRLPKRSCHGRKYNVLFVSSCNSLREGLQSRFTHSDDSSGRDVVDVSGTSALRLEFEHWMAAHDSALRTPDDIRTFVGSLRRR